MKELKLLVGETGKGSPRLDRYCTAHSGDVSRSRLKNGAMEILVNGKPAKLSKQVKTGDEIILRWEDPAPQDITAEDIPLSILYEDDNVTVVNKAQGMVTHPGAGNWTGTLVHALLWHWKREGKAENPRPGIVHRLDKDTSGIIITARNPETETFLQGEFRNRRARKVYAAILCGIPNSRDGIIETRLIRDPKNRKRFTWTDDPAKGKHSKTGYRVVRTYGKYALVLFKLYTGRTHQLRVHSKFIGCPILGDPVYGKKDGLFPGATLMLHARRLKIRIPGGVLSLCAPLPSRFARIIETLQREYGK